MIYFIKHESRRKWRQANFKSKDGTRGIIPDKWDLVDAANQPVARIALELDGETAGNWRWFIFVHPHGAPLGETGLCDSIEQAREICERRVPDWTISRLPKGRKKIIF